MIKAFLFDNGGVMASGGTGHDITDRLSANLGISTEAADALFMIVCDDYFRGKITEPELWNIIEKHYGKPINPDLRAVWNLWKDMQPLPEMVELVQQLKSGGYPVGMLSNVIPNTEKEVRAHGGYNLFDFTVLSCEVGYVKPEPEIYKIALEKLGNPLPEGVVFLDDMERCLVPAREMGMQTILVKSPAQAIADVNRLLSA